MSTDRDVTRTVRSWLEEGATALPDRVLDSVLDQLPTTPQRRTFGLARRFLAMNSTVRVALAATAVVVVALIGYQLFVAPNVGSPGPAEPTPTVAPTSSIAPISSPRPLKDAWVLLEPGTYVAGDPFLVGVTYTVPAGWGGHIGGPYLVDAGPFDKPGGIFFLIFDKVAADPCQSDAGYIDLPPTQSVDDLATALANMPGIEVTEVSDVSVDGYSGTQLTMSAPDSFADCALSSDGYVIWQLPLGATFNMTPSERDRVLILDVAGERLVILVQDLPAFTDTDRAEVQAVFDSIRIEPAN